MWLIFLFIRGFSLIEIAWFEGIFHITSLVAEIPTGAIADMFGRKTSRILGILSYFIFIVFILYSTSFVMMAIGFVFCSLSYVFESGAGEALIYDSLIEMKEESTFMKFMGKKEVIFQVSGFIALLIGGTVASYGEEWNFYITAFMFVMALFMIVSMKEVGSHESDRVGMKEQVKRQFLISFQTVFKNKRLFILIIIGAMMTAPTTTIFFYFQNYLYDLGFSYPIITVFIGLHAGASSIGGYFAYKLEKKFGERKLLYIIPLVITLSFWLVTMEQIFLIPFIILGLMDSIFYVILFEYINQMVSSEVRATVLSVFGMMFSLIMIGLFLLAGYIMTAYGFSFGFMVIAIIVSIFYVFSLIVVRGDHLNQDIMTE
jgi:MFS family permease